MQDNYDQAIRILNGVSVLLWGGYYEPYSDRDIELAKKVDNLLDELNRSKL